MAIKEELKEEVKEEGGGQDELDALDTLEKEAKEYNKVRPSIQLDQITVLNLLLTRMPKSIVSFKLLN